MTTKSEAVREIVSLAGGRIVGKTRLQKAAFILELSGLGYDFSFSYHHYGPYSEDLTWATKDAVVEKAIVEQQDQARWGGTYSVFVLAVPCDAHLQSSEDKARADLLSYAVRADAVVLELAATAALLKTEGCEDWWGETARRKSLKATPEAILEAKKLWQELAAVDVPKKLPTLN